MRTSSPVSGSLTFNLAAFRNEQETQGSAKLLVVVGPPALTGTT